MRFTTKDGISGRVYFNHPFIDRKGNVLPKEDSNNSGNRRVTFCEISLDNKENEEATVIAKESVICNPVDSFQKSAGRKLALAKALKNVANRSTRSDIWKRYFETHNDLKKSKDSVNK